MNRVRAHTLVAVMFVVVVFVVEGAGCATRAAAPANAESTPADAPAPPDDTAKAETAIVVQSALRRRGSLGCEEPPPCNECLARATERGHAPQGMLDKEAIRGVIQSHTDEARACYEARLIRPPYAQGVVRVRFAIAPTGRVASSCLVSSTLGDAQVELCVADHVLGWRFPNPAGAGWVVTSYPFKFVLAPDAEGTGVPEPKDFPNGQ